MYEKKLFRELCQLVNTPVSLVYDLSSRVSDEILVRPAVHPWHYSRYDDFALDYAVSNFLRKQTKLDINIDRRKVALLQFEDAEVINSVTNNRLLDFRNDGKPSSMRNIISYAQHLCERVVGDPSGAQLMERSCWGPGATASRKAEDARLDKKIRNLPISSTAMASELMQIYLRDAYPWKALLCRAEQVGPSSLTRDSFDIRESSRLLTVDKDASTDRVICAEPDANLFLQKGVGSYLRSRLKHVGLDLSDQSINQKLARDALTSGLATLDLSNASNTISYEIVRLLMPPSFFSYLCRLRCSEVTYDGKSKRLEMFSSMGNGFTFELETLIFWALSKAVVNHLGLEGRVSVYGDDIIVPARATELLTEVFNFTGFTVNQKKSFSQGLFYESCGSHFYNGLNCTPMYQKEVINCPSSSMRCLNRIFAWSNRLPLGSRSHRVAVRFWHIAFRMLAAEFPILRSVVGPAHLGDQVVHIPEDKVKTSSTVHSLGNDLYSCLTLVDRKPLFYHLGDTGLIACAVFDSNQLQDDRKRISGRNSYLRIRPKTKRREFWLSGSHLSILS